MDEDGLAQLYTVKRIVGKFQHAEAFDDDLEVLKESMEACPVEIIKIR